VHIAYSITGQEEERKKENQGCVAFFWCKPQIELKLFYNSHLVTSTNYHLGGWQLIGFTPFSLSLQNKVHKNQPRHLSPNEKNWHFGLLSALFHWLSRIFNLKMVFIPHFRLH
jgi:hypothetical protein